MLGRSDYEGLMRLHFGDVQIAAGVVFAVLASVILAVFAVVARRAAGDVPADAVQSAGYRLRKPWLASLVLLGVVLVGASFFLLPYASGADADRTVVVVKGGQFFWTITPGEVPVDTPIRFDVGAVDVNHGFGIYDPRGRMVGSVQAMPGVSNELDLTFGTTGEYRVLCLEYCGLNHHAMEAGFRVVAR
jgi:cytochrome c oxidase subunit 2